MDATFIHDGSEIDYTPSGAVAAGDVIEQGELIGVAKRAIAANELGSIAVSGVFDFPKATSSSSAIAVGAKCYWDAGGEIAETDTSGNVYIGKCTLTAGADDATVRIRLDQ